LKVLNSMVTNLKVHIHQLLQLGKKMKQVSFNFTRLSLFNMSIGIIICSYAVK